MSRKPHQVQARRRAMLDDLPLSAALGFAPNELEEFAFDRYKLSNEARDIAIIAARAHPFSAMRCYMAIFFSV